MCSSLKQLFAGHLLPIQIDFEYSKICQNSEVRILGKKETLDNKSLIRQLESLNIFTFHLYFDSTTALLIKTYSDATH